MKHLALFATLVISMGVVACHKAAAPASTLPVAITIFPTATQTVLPGATITFTETVTNTTNTAVTWEVNGNVGGDITVGTISTTGLYTAPSLNNVINPFDVTVTVVSSASTSTTASTTVAIELPPPVSIAPVSATTVAAGATQQFTPTTTPANQNVFWYVNNVQGGNSVVGTVSPTGLYTAPQVPSRPARSRSKRGLAVRYCGIRGGHRSLDVLELFAAKFLCIFASWERPQRPSAARRKHDRRWPWEHHGRNRRHQ